MEEDGERTSRENRDRIEIISVVVKQSKCNVTLAWVPFRLREDGSHNSCPECDSDLNIASLR